MTFQRKITLGQTIYKFKMSDDMIDKINKIYDKKSKDMIAHNEHLAGKIVEQKRIDNYLDDDVKQFFLQSANFSLSNFFSNDDYVFLNLGAIGIIFGLNIKLNFASIIGFSISYYFLRYFR